MSMIPDSKVHGANMGPIWDWEDPGGSHVGPMTFAIWDMHKTGLVTILIWGALFLINLNNKWKNNSKMGLG